MCLAQSGRAGRNGLASNKQTTPPGSYLHRPLAKRNGPSFDHLVGACEQRCWHFEAEGLGGFEVDVQLEFGRLLHWQSGNLGALKDAVDIRRCPMKQIGRIDTVRYQAAALHEHAEVKYRRQAMTSRKCDDQITMSNPNPIDQNPWAHWRSPMDMMRQG